MLVFPLTPITSLLFKNNVGKLRYNTNTILIIPVGKYEWSSKKKIIYQTH